MAVDSKKLIQRLQALSDLLKVCESGPSPQVEASQEERCVELLLDMLSIEIKITMHDLESCRREKQFLATMLENATGEDGSSV